MAVLSNVDLRERLGLATEFAIVVDPLAPNAVQPSSIDVRLGNELFIWTGSQRVDLTLDQSDQWSSCEIVTEGEDAQRGPYFWLWPKVLYLGTTMEYVEVPPDLVGNLRGKSTNARVGIVPHQEAGLLDPGYCGRPTVEITVMMPTILRPGMLIGQITFEELTCPADPPYSGRYQGDTKPTPARLLEAHRDN